MHWIWAWAEDFGATLDREVVQRIGERDTLLEAFEKVISVELAAGMPAAFVSDLLTRVNALRREWGYPELQLADLVPTVQEPSDESADEVSSADALPYDEGLGWDEAREKDQA